MAFEILTVENWLFTTLSTDATLAQHLAVDGRAPFYQQGVYSNIAPEIDPRSMEAPEFPLIVFQRMGSRASDGITICGDRVLVQPVYQVGIWDVQYGGLSFARLQAIADRVDALLDNQVCGTVPPAWCRRMDSNTLFEQQEDGRIDLGITGNYVFQIQS